MLAQFLAASLHFVAAFVATLVAARLLEPLARRTGWLDHPRGRKAHATALPLTGGAAIALGVAAALLLDPAAWPAFRGFVVAAALLLMAGIADDFLDLPWPLRMGLQVIAVLALIHVGDLHITSIELPIGSTALVLDDSALPFVVLVAVGVINAFNMVDGGDGIAAAIALATLALFGIACATAGNRALVQAIALPVGAIGGFFALNMRFAWRPHARLFLGDGGSNLIGLAIVWLGLASSPSHAGAMDWSLLPWLAAPPLIDCIATILRRLRERRSPFRADRGHLHHLLLDAGLATSQVAWLLAALTLALGALALCAAGLGLPPAALLIAFIGLVAAHVALTRDRARFIARVRRWRQRFGALANESALR